MEELINQEYGLTNFEILKPLIIYGFIRNIRKKNKEKDLASIIDITKYFQN